jgi:O-antigen/teichoic acid export membrane protein
MSAASKTSLQGLKRRALTLGAVKVLDHAFQFLLPVVLVRCLDTAAFGEYRLLWLAVGTMMVAAPLNMAGSLYYFVPRSEPGRKRLYVHQTMLYLLGAGLVCAFLVSPWNPALPATLHPLQPHGWWVSAFVAMWVFTVLLDHLPSVDERISWQVYAMLTVSVLRVVLIALGAWLTGDLRVLIGLLVVIGLIKVGVLMYYVRRQHGLGQPWFERAAFADQFRHAAPIGTSHALNAMRSKSDQWVAATLFSMSSFAAFSIAALVSQVMLILRTSVMQVFLPSMSRLQAQGDLRGMLDMNSRGNVLVARLLYPVLAFAFVFAEELVMVVYTAAYVQAVPAIRTYIIGMLPMAIETASLVLLLRRGKFTVCVTTCTLALSVAVSWSAAMHVGIAGAAAGSVLAIYVERIILLRHLARHTGTALRRLQHWRALLTAAAFASATGALAWVAVERLFIVHGPFARLIVGATVFGVAYAATHLSQGLVIRKHKDAT